MDVNQAIDKVENDLAQTLQEITEARDLLRMLDDDRKKLELELHGLQSFARRLGDNDQPARRDQSGPASLTASDHTNADVVPISGSVQPLHLTLHSSGRGDTTPLTVMSRTDAVLTIMQATSAPLDRAAIHEQLVHGGREDDSLDNVSLTLSGLKRSGRVERLGKGLWQLVSTPTTRPVEPDRLRSIES